MSIAKEILERAVYPPEKVIEARVIDLQAEKAIPLLQLPEVPPHLIKLHELGMARMAEVTAIVKGTRVGKAYEARLHGLAVPDIDEPLPLNALFDEDVFVEFYSTAAIANYQARVIFEIKPYTVADKLALGVSPAALDEEERALIEKFDLAEKVASQYLPMPYPKGALVTQEADNFAGDLGAGEEKNVLEIATVEPGRKAVLRRIWARRPTTNVGELEIRIYRGRPRKLYFTIRPYCLPEFKPINLWIPAVDALFVTVYSGPGHTDVRVLATADIRKLTVWDKIGWGLLGRREITPEWEARLVRELGLEDKLRAGLYEILTPVRG